MRASYHRSLGTSPGRLVFGCDMIMPEIEVDRQVSLESATALSKRFKSNAALAAKAKRIEHTYKVKDLVLVKNQRISKTSPRFLGPYEIVNVYNNNTVRLLKENKCERVNIRKLKPFKERQDVASRAYNTCHL